MSLVLFFWEVFEVFGGSWYAVRGSDRLIRGKRYFMFKLSWYGAEGAENLDLVHVGSPSWYGKSGAKYLGTRFGRKQKKQ